jgi:aminopeptidase N
MMRAFFFLTLFMLPGHSILWGQLLTGEELIKSEQRGFTQSRTLRSNSGTDYGYSVHHQTLHLKVNPNVSDRLQGVVQICFRTMRNMDTVRVDLRDELQVFKVTHGSDTLRWDHRNHQLFVLMNRNLQAGAYDSFSVHYSGNPSRGSGFGYYVRDRHQTGNIIHTLSQPYGAPYWWPCKSTLDDKLDSVDILVSTAKGLRAASNGLLVDERLLNDSTVLFHWKHRYPIAPYLVAIAVSNYIPFTDHAHFHNRVDSLPVLNYVFPQSFSSARVEALQTLPMLRLFDSLFGEYPFMNEKYGHAQFTWGGGMEHQTMSFMVNFSFDLIAHELAHMWFGDAVTCGSWEDLWLNEGWATYANALCYEFLKNRSAFRARLEDMQKYVMSQPGGSVFPTDTQNIGRLFDGRLTYNKGALVYHMLRWQLGDSLFFAGVRNYLASPARRYGFARTLDFQNYLEDVSGQDLTPFFNDWYIGEGYPTFNIDWLMTGNRLKVQVKQSTSHPSVQYFDLKIPVLFKGLPSDTLLVLTPRDGDESFEFILNTQVEDAFFDPDQWLLAQSVITGRNANLGGSGSIQVYPNPGRAAVQVYSKNQRISLVELCDLSGRQLLSKELPDGLYGTELDLRAFSNGIYVMRVTASGGVYFTKFEIQ